MGASERDRLFDEEFLERLQRLHVLAKGAAARCRPGRRQSRRIGDGLEFADHRSYFPGDDVRFIDWPYYARMDRLLLRMFHERSEAEVACLLDVSASMAPGGDCERFDAARRLAAALAFVAMGGLDRVSVHPFAGELATPFRGGRNRGQVLALLDFLAGLRAAGPTRLARCADRFARAASEPATVLILSDLLACRDGLDDALAALGARGCDVAVVHVHTPADAGAGLDGPVRLEDAETGEAVNVDVTDAVRRSYAERWREFRDVLHRTAAARGAVYVPASTDVPMEKLVLQTLRRAGVLTG